MEEVHSLINTEARRAKTEHGLLDSLAAPTAMRIGSRGWRRRQTSEVVLCHIDPD